MSDLARSWPDEVALNLWALPPARLAEVLTDLVPVASEGPASYYADTLATVVGLAVGAPAARRAIPLERQLASTLAADVTATSGRLRPR